MMFLKSKYNNIDASGAITSQMAMSVRNNVFNSPQTTNTVLPNIFRRLEVKGKVRVMFSKRRDGIKDKCRVISSYKQRNKTCLVFLD